MSVQRYKKIGRYTRKVDIFFKKDRFYLSVIQFYCSAGVNHTLKLPAGYATTPRPLYLIYGLVVSYLWLLCFHFSTFCFSKGYRTLSEGIKTVRAETQPAPQYPPNVFIACSLRAPKNLLIFWKSIFYWHTGRTECP